MASDVLYALDFDGVLCDSEPESSQSAVRAARFLWGREIAVLSDPAPAWLLRALRLTRPVVQTGFENVVLARAFAEGGAGIAGAVATRILTTPWQPLCDSYMESWGVDEKKLVEAFADARNRWIDADESSWSDASRLYPGVSDALNFAAADVYIVTTKQTEFVERLLARNGVVGIPRERIYGYGSGSKISTLKEIMKKANGRVVEFVEDRYDTLEKASLSLLGLPLSLYLATWGYNTDAEREEADNHPFITPIDLNAFVGRLQ